MNIKSLKDGILLRKFIRYTLIGGLGAGINVFFLWFFTHVTGIYYIVSAILAFIISVVVGFIFQKKITFKNTTKKHTKQLFLFVVFQGIGLVLDLFLLRLLVSKGGFYYIYVSVFNKGIIFIWNFIMNHFFTFYKNE
ncbi:MAG: GtrA family protein [candidate division SR1 bacterium]|nr:GtrA family protein [candidate division SR1 bacterium]